MCSTTINLLNHSIDIVLFLGSLLPVVKTDHEVTCRGTLAEHHTITGSSRICLDLRDVSDARINLSHHLLGLCDIGSRRSSYVHIDRTHILLRYETGLGCVHKIYKSAAGNDKHNQCQPFALEHKQHDMLIFIHELSESCIKSIVESCREAHLLTFFRFLVRSHDQCTEGRGEGKRIKE